MAIFGIKTKDEQPVIDFIDETNDRLLESNYIKNPFTGKIKFLYRDGEESFYLVKMKPIYFNFSWLGVIAGGFSTYFISYWFSLAIIFFLFLGLFWHSCFYFVMLRLGLKKRGYKGPVNFVFPGKLLEGL